MKLLRYAAAICGILCLWSAEAKEYPVYKIARTPKIDGVLDDYAWKKLPEGRGFVTTAKGNPYAKERSTRFKMGYRGDFLYLAVECDEPSTGKIIGSSSVTLTVVAVPYRLSWGDTSALSSASTIRDLLACVITTKLDPAASDVTTVQVMLVTATKVTYFDGNLDGNLISGMTYVVSVGDHGLIYDMVSITIA